MQKAEFSLSWWAMGPKIRPEPKGVVLIIAPFNGPVVMLLSPLVRRPSRCACFFVDELGAPCRSARSRAVTQW